MDAHTPAEPQGKVPSQNALSGSAGSRGAASAALPCSWHTIIRVFTHACMVQAWH